MLKTVREYVLYTGMAVLRKISAVLRSTVLFFSIPARFALLVLITGALFKMTYAARVPYNISDHDLGAIRIEIPDTNHIGYMQYLERDRKLPELSPLENWGMLHPPLFHIIGAVFIHINDAGRSVKKIQASMEQLQLLNMFFACVLSFYVFAFVKELGIKENMLPATAAFSGFFPSFFHIGAALNNDCLMTLFVVMGLYYTVRWYKNRTAANMTKITVCFVLGMLVKSSACLVVPAVFYVFLCALLEAVYSKKQEEPYGNNNEVFRISVQIALFLVVFMSAGFSWLIREYIKFGMPFNYMNDASVYAWQHVSSCSWRQRLFLPVWQQIAVIPYNDSRPDLSCNIWGELFLTMNFDEFKLYSVSALFSAGAVLMLWNSIALALAGFYGMCRMFFMGRTEFWKKILVALVFFVPFLSFIYMCFRYQHRACMNFRLIAYIPMAAMAGVSLYLCRNSAGSFFEKFIKCSCYLYAALSAVLFSFWG